MTPERQRSCSTEERSSSYSPLEETQSFPQQPDFDQWPENDNPVIQEACDEIDTPDELTLAEAAKLYGYAPHTLLQAIQRGSLPGYKDKLKVVVEVDAWFVQREDVEAYIEQAKRRGKGPTKSR